MYPRKMKRTFQESLAIGASGEKLVIKELSKVTQVRDYTDYKYNKGYQQKGFDIEFFNNNTQTWDRADIKTNVHSGWTKAELTKPNGNLGWAYTSKADYIICVDKDYNKIYYYSLTDLRNYLERKRKENTLKVSMTNDGYYLTSIPVDHKQLIKTYNDLVNLVGSGTTAPSTGII